MASSLLPLALPFNGLLLPRSSSEASNSCAFTLLPPSLVLTPHRHPSTTICCALLPPSQAPLLTASASETPPTSPLQSIALPIIDAPENGNCIEEEEEEEDKDEAEELHEQSSGSDPHQKQLQLQDVGRGEASSNVSIAKECARRRNFAIISHPDAGKTTLVSN